MSTTMHDSVTPTDIPKDAAMVAGYVTGRYAWPESGWARFPHARKVEIATQARFNTGDVLDVEKGDATPEQAPGWVRMRRAAGVARPSLYCSAADVPALRRAMGNDVTWDLWVARYTGRVPGPADFARYGSNCVAIQYANANTSGGHFDLSLVIDDGWPHRAHPTPPPPPMPGDDTVQRFYKIRDEAHPDKPAPSPKGDGIFTTADAIEAKFVNEAAWVHFKNLGWWDETHVELIPETAHAWLVSDATAAAVAGLADQIKAALASASDGGTGQLSAETIDKIAAVILDAEAKRLEG
jgi:hypothetical protein